MAKKKTQPLPLQAPATQRPLPIRIAKLHSKLLIAAAWGLAALIPLHGHGRMATQLLLAWDLGVALYLVLTFTLFSRCNVERIRKRASEQDEGALAILLLTVAATLASLVAIVFEIGGMKQAIGGHGAMQALLAGVTILLSWAFVHTIFSIHYAHEYYGEHRDGKLGGLTFPGDQEPDYWDFLYFSLVIGMTSQVSDVAITSNAIRRVVSMHGVLAFFFNVTVLALTVNMMSNLI